MNAKQVKQLIKLVDSIETAIFIRQLDNEALTIEIKEKTRKRYLEYLENNLRETDFTLDDALRLDAEGRDIDVENT